MQHQLFMFLALKSDSYRSTKHFHTLSFYVAIVAILLLAWLYSLLTLLSADVELNLRPKRVPISNISICGALRGLVPFVQFKIREKHPWRSVNFSKIADLKPATLLKLTLLHGCFSRF